MGIYDIFIDGNSSIQLKNFDCDLMTYKKGDRVHMSGIGAYGPFNYPKNGIFFCLTDPVKAVVIQNSVFIGIMDLKKKAIKKYPFGVWDCLGNKHTMERNLPIKNKKGVKYV